MSEDEVEPKRRRTASGSATEERNEPVAEQGVQLRCEHHVQAEFCYTRPAYRQGRKFTAVKVYTVCDESLYILIQGVPSVNLENELKKACEKFGKVAFLRKLPDYPPIEQFTETWLARYKLMPAARHAKRFLDGKNFFGGSLHVCYAPENESVAETRSKLTARRDEVRRRKRKLGHTASSSSSSVSERQ